MKLSRADEEEAMWGKMFRKRRALLVFCLVIDFSFVCSSTNQTIRQVAFIYWFLSCSVATVDEFSPRGGE